MSRQILRRSAAIDDLVEIAAYIGEDNPSASARFLDRAEQAFDDLAAMPGMGRSAGFARADIADLHVWSVPGFRSYLIFYRFDEPTLEIVRVLHGARDLRHILGDASDQ